MFKRVSHVLLSTRVVKIDRRLLISAPSQRPARIPAIGAAYRSGHLSEKCLNPHKIALYVALINPTISANLKVSALAYGPIKPSIVKFFLRTI